MRPLQIGLVYDLLGTRLPAPGAPPDADAEFEPVETLETIEQAFAHAGHATVRLGNAHDLLARASKGEVPRVDAALSIAEGSGSRNREAWAPVLLEMLGIPTLGSDALTLSLTLDKAWCKAVVGAAGVPVAPHVVVAHPAELASLRLPFGFPLFVKPRWEGTAKGIGPASRVEDPEALREQVARLVEAYRQPALIEPFLSGPEYTVTVVGHAPPRVLPVLQRALEKTTGIGLHALERHSRPGAGSGWEYEVPGVLEPSLEASLAQLAREAFQALECRDFARVDVRLDAAGAPFFLEINPLPTFAPDGSFAFHAELEGRSTVALLAEVFDGALDRLDLG